MNGFCDWKHSKRISDHEKSTDHRHHMLALLNRSKHLSTVDASLCRQIEAEQNYWKEVLRRVVAVVKFLGKRGLPFPGHDEILGSPHNGNYLGLLELIAEFDPFLQEHIKKHGQKGKGKPSYLSSGICEEFISLMGNKTKNIIAAEIQQAKYFSVVVDSTPDLSHVDQLTFIFRFVSTEGKVVERFLGFEPLHSHTGASLAECVLKMVRDLGLDLSNCRGQSYDNASNMSGKYNGLQAHLKMQNPLIHYMPCVGHSLNLVGMNSIDDSCEEVTSFFYLLQSLYTFCSTSTQCWNKIFHDSHTHISLTLKSLCGTRWSCRADSTKALHDNYNAIRDALAKIAKDCDEKADTRCEAAALVGKLNKLETVLMTILWNRVLSRFKATSVNLQKRDMDLATAVHLLRSLNSYVGTLREQFAEVEESARTISVTQSYQYDVRCLRKRKRFADESSDDTEVTFTDGSERFKVEAYYVIMDRLRSCLSKWIDAYIEVYDLFGVLFCKDCTESDLRTRAHKLSSTYPEDLDKALADELIQFRHFSKDKTSPAELLQIVDRNGLKTIFPNVYVALRLFLTLPITNCEGERSFSTLKRVKNELRTTMAQNRLSALSLLAIESELVWGLDFEDIICEFAWSKSRKRPF
ncbi:ZMYM1 protein, partial [Amia calva]|nr:ZMYM1 protein [Amia calva]